MDENTQPQPATNLTPADNAEADGYYGEGAMGDKEVDLSFLDDETSEE